ncbi:MAG: hypothetical protein ACK5MY_15475 [Jhaorihella sp.]
MHALQRSYRGLGLVMQLNWDRIISFLTIAFALVVGAYVGSLFGGL